MPGTESLPTIPISCIEAGPTGLVYEFRENNAPRSCTECNEQADYYVFLAGHISESFCREHFKEAPRERVLEDGQ